MKQGFINYVIRIGDATSQLANVVFLWSQNPNESISGRAWRLRNKAKAWGVARVVIDFVFFLEDNHCKSAYEADIKRAVKLIEQQSKEKD